jgi:hypothetical protein
MTVEYLIDSKGNKKSVQIPINEFEQLLEDLEDLKTVAERKNEDLYDHHIVKEILNNNAEL